MSLEKKQVIGQMEVGELCNISVRTDTVIIDDGEEVSRSFHRHVVSPGDDVSGEADSVQATASALWTSEVIAAWEAAQPEPTPDPIEEPVEEPVVTEEGE